MSTNPPIALTTVFTPPSSCISTITYDGTSFWQNGYNQTGDPDCYPPFFSNIFNSFFTPAICPQSWTSAGTIVQQGATVTHGEILGAEFNAMCCPRGFKLARSQGSPSGDFHNFCTSVFNTDLTNVFSTSSLQTGPLPNNARVTSIRAADMAQNTIFADVIQVRWQSTDSDVLKLLGSLTAGPESTIAAPSPVSAVASPTSTLTSPTTTPAPTISLTPSTSSASKSISLGVTIGIGVAVSVAVLTMVLTAFLCCRRRRIPKVATNGKESMYPANPPQPYVEKRAYRPAEMGACEVSELTHSTRVAELPQPAFTAELPSRWF